MADYVFEMTLNEHGNRLDKVLARRLDDAIEGGFSRNKTSKLLDAGKVRYNGDVERFGSRTVEYDDIVEVDVDESIVGSPKRHRKVHLSDDDVLWRDEYVLAVDKPSGLPSQATRDPNRDHLVAAVRRYLKSDGVDDPYVAVHQRLDVGTSGVMVLAIDRRANKGLSEAFQNRDVDKTYRALARAYDDTVERDATERWSVENHLTTRGSGASTRQVAVNAGGDWARTDFEVKRRAGWLYEIAASPKTGRRHQIRAHLAGEGLPIVGDRRYGGMVMHPRMSIDRLMLHAHRLRLDHPVTDRVIEVVSPVPELFEQIWQQVGE